MIVELDDLHERSHRVDLLVQLREANPLFRATVFAIPFLSPDGFLESLPEWLEVAVHGWDHRHEREAAGWTREQAIDVLLACGGRFVSGFKAPGYAASPGCYQALVDLGWWVRDVPAHSHLWPGGLRVYAGAEDYWCDTIAGLPSRFPRLLQRVRAATEFEFVSEAAREQWTAAA